MQRLRVWVDPEASTRGECGGDDIDIHTYYREKGREKMVLLTQTLLTLSHFSPKTVFSVSLSSSLRRARRNFHFCPRIVACRAMGSPEQQGFSASLDSVTQDLQNHNLQSHKLKLEDLNWDHSFVRELPPDPRTDPLPREVFLTPHHPHHFYLLLFLYILISLFIYSFIYILYIYIYLGRTETE